MATDLEKADNYLETPSSPNDGDEETPKRRDPLSLYS